MGYIIHGNFVSNILSKSIHFVKCHMPNGNANVVDDDIITRSNWLSISNP